jgi:hypothetical protein
MASGETFAFLKPTDAEPPSSNYATLDQRNGHPVLEFDQTTNESAVFSLFMPDSYAGGGLTVELVWCSETASGDVDWDVAIERIGDAQQDIDSDGFAAVQSTDNNTVPGTSGNTDVTTITFTDGAQMDSVAAGEMFRLKVTRDAASDTLADDAQLLGVLVRETGTPSGGGGGASQLTFIFGTTDNCAAGSTLTLKSPGSGGDSEYHRLKLPWDATLVDVSLRHRGPSSSAEVEIRADGSLIETITLNGSGGAVSTGRTQTYSAGDGIWAKVTETSGSNRVDDAMLILRFEEN